MNKRLLRILLTALLLAVAVAVQKNCFLPLWQQLLLFLVPYVLIAWDVVAEAFEALWHGEAFNEDFLMVVATAGALCIGFLPGAAPQFAEAVFVMLFFQVGELFEGYAEDRSRRSISSLMAIRPDSAVVERGGEEVEVHPSTVVLGETILVRPGEKIALDGIVVEGSSSLNTVALTGESVPAKVDVGTDVASGCVNLTAPLRIRVSKTFGQSTASRIIELVEKASQSKSHSETFIRRFARIYTPVVVFAAIALAVLPPLVLSLAALSSSSFATLFPVWLYRALTFLIVSCPCALVLSVPLAFFAGIGGAGKKGILIKGGNFMEMLAHTTTVVFDKTGTLTKGVFTVTAVHPEKLDATQLLHLAAHVERFCNHPIAVSLKNAYPNEHDGCSVENVEEVAGQGIRASVNGRTVCLGNAAMMEAVGAEWHPCHHTGTIVHIAIEGIYAGHIVISDVVKADAAEAVTSLRKTGVKRIVMLTGDRVETAEQVAQAVGVDECRASLLPAGKVEQVERLLQDCGRRDRLAFVGDGINDAPVLARADVGIAMGGLGSDAAIEAADVVLMDDSPSKLPTAIRLARRTLRTARRNVVFAVTVKLAILLLAAFGLAGMGLAVFGDVGVTVLAVLNSMRNLK